MGKIQAETHMRILEDFFNDIDTINVHETDDSEFPFILTAYTTKQMMVY